MINLYRLYDTEEIDGVIVNVFGVIMQTEEMKKICKILHRKVQGQAALQH